MIFCLDVEWPVVCGTATGDAAAARSELRVVRGMVWGTPGSGERAGGEPDHQLPMEWNNGLRVKCQINAISTTCLLALSVFFLFSPSFVASAL